MPLRTVLGVFPKAATADQGVMPQSRAKGARGEREAADAWEAATGLLASRTAQRCGRHGTADILVGTDRLHCEVKRRAKVAAIAFLRQAIRDAAPNATPFVLMREDGDTQWVAMLRLDDLVSLANAVTAARKEPLL